MSRRGYNSIQSLLPDGYEPLEYIESTGAQYIIVNDYRPTTSAVVKCRYRKSTDATTIFQVGKGNTRIMLYPVNNTRIDYCYGSGYKNLTVDNGDDSIGVWYDVEMNYQHIKKNNHIYQINGTPNVQTNINLHLFSNDFGSGVTVYPNALSRISIENINGNINLIAALRIVDSKPGLYDLCGSICPLTGTPFYINAGTGEFLYN